MKNKLDAAILETFGIDTAELAQRCTPLVESGIANEHEKVIQACATVIAISFKSGAVQEWWGAALALFAVGYEAGKNAPDLSVFEGILTDNEL